MKTAAPDTALSAAPGPTRSWATSHLARLSEPDLSALLDLMPAWYHQRTWEIPKRCNPRRVWQYIDRHGLGGVMGALQLAGQVTGPVRLEAAQARYFSNMLYFEQARQCCRHIQKKARAKDIPLVFVKGAVLAEEAYQDGGVRAFSDIDVIVPSRYAGTRLAAALGARIFGDGLAAGVVARVRDPACFKMIVAGWEIELRYPMPGQQDSLYALINGLDFGARQTTASGLDVPELEWHIAFLVQHMAIQHFFSRFVWFLDLAALFRAAAACIDMPKLKSVLARQKMLNQMAAVSWFCRHYIDPQFPRFDPVPRSWNHAFVTHMVKARTIAQGRFNKRHETIRGLIFAFLFSIAHLFLLTDPPTEGPPWRGTAGQGISRRLCAALSMDHRLVERLLAPAVRMGLLPAIWLLARVFNLSIPSNEDGVP